MYYYTSEAQENKLAEKYEKMVDEKQDELNSTQKKSGKIQKYSARACISIPQRVFIVQKGLVYLGSVSQQNICPKDAKDGGKIYAVDSDYKEYVETFLQNCDSYSVKFMPSGKYGPTVDYCGKPYEMPAIIERYDGQRLVVEDVEKYELGVL